MSQQQTILITGASTGIGKSTAEFFQLKGWNVIATMRDPEHGSELAKLDNVLVARLDVTQPTTIHKAVLDGIARFGQIDVLVNNAGYGAYGPLEAASMDNVRRQFDTNVIGLLETTKAILPHLRARRTGVIVNISSIGGKITFPLGTLYHGTKFAVEGLSESLAYEMSAIGVKVKIVEPGAIKTDFAGRSFNFNNDESLAEYQPVVQSLMTAMGPMMGNAAEPVVVAEAIYQAATDGTDQLRYLAGEDAKVFIAKRAEEDDATYIGGVRKQFGL